MAQKPQNRPPRWRRNLKLSAAAASASMAHLFEIKSFPAGRRPSAASVRSMPVLDQPAQQGRRFGAGNRDQHAHRHLVSPWRPAAASSASGAVDGQAQLFLSRQQQVDAAFGHQLAAGKMATRSQTRCTSSSRWLESRMVTPCLSARLAHQPAHFLDADRSPCRWSARPGSAARATADQGGGNTQPLFHADREVMHLAVGGFRPGPPCASQPSISGSRHGRWRAPASVRVSAAVRKG